MSLDIDRFLQPEKLPAVSLPALPPGHVSVSIRHSEASTQGASTIHEAGTSSEAPKSASAYTAFESRTSLIERVMNALKGDGTDPIVICGLGGIGKTTLLNEVFNWAKGEGNFNKVAMADYGRIPKFEKIQGDIAEFLGLTLSEGGSHIRAGKLSKRLDCGKRVLVILDDVWQGIDFQKAGIPRSRNCKILISSRNKNIYGQKNDFPISGLRDDEAWSLFKEMAGSSIESTELRTIAKAIVKECAGLPLAISTVGVALKEKCEQTWKDALRQLRKKSPQSIPEVLAEVYPKLEFSYDCLEKKDAKPLFLFCSLYPEGSDIRVEDLVRHGLGLQLYEGISSMEEGRDRVGALIEELKNRSLLLDSNKKECVKMHDLLHGVALHIASLRFQQNENRFFVRHGVELDGWRSVEGTGAQQHTCSALITKGTHGDVAELLFLSCTDDSIVPLEAALEGMEKLKVLEIKKTNFQSILPVLKVLKSLQTLCLEHCVLGDVSIIGELRTLMILSLRGSSINQLPVSFRNLANLWLLDSTGCKSKEQILISPGVISSLRNLKELYTLGQANSGFVTGLGDSLYMRHFIEVSSGFDTGRGDSFMPTEVVPELLSLCHLTTLEVHLPKISFESLQSSSSTEVHLFDRLERFKISIGHRRRRARAQAELDLQALDVDSCHNILRLIDFDGNSLAGSCIVRLLKKTETLELQMNELTTEALNVLDGECFSNLKSLILINCDALEYVIDTTSTVQRHTFPVLDSLTIFGAYRMRKLCNGNSAGLFKELRCVKVSSCARLTSLFPFSVARGLPELEELDIERCPMLKEIIELGEGDQHAEKKVPEMTLPNLIHLNLVNLLNLVSISPNLISFPLLVSVKLQNLPKFVSLCPSVSALASSSSSATTKPLFDIQDESFLQLRFVEVIRCTRISSIFSSNSMPNLQNLEHLKVENCGSLGTLFNVEDIAMEAERDSTMLSCLEKMELIGLPMSESVWKTEWEIIAFKNLELLRIKYCDTLRSVFPLRKLMQRWQHLKHFNVENCRLLVTLFDFEDIAMEAELDSTILSCLEKMELIGLPMLESIWKTSKITTFMNLEFLHIKECDKLSSMFPFRMLMQSLQHLKHLKVENCRSLVTLFDFEDLAREAELDSTMLPCLEKMELIGLPMLESIWKTSKIATFMNLEFLHIKECVKLSSMFSLRMLMQSLQHLKHLKVENCRSLVTLFDLEDLAREAELDSTMLSCLEKMELIGLPMLESIWKTSKITTFMNLEFLHIKECDKLSSVFPLSMLMQSLQNLKHLKVEKCQSLVTLFNFEDLAREAELDSTMLSRLEKMELIGLPMLESIWKTESKITAFQNLVFLQIQLCKSLKCVFPLYIAERLVNLEEFLLTYCMSMEEIICRNEGNGVDEDETRNRELFSQLKVLKLEKLHGLRRFCGATSTIELPLLTELQMITVPTLKTFVANQSYNTTDSQFRSHIFSEMVHTPNLEKLKIEEIPSLKEIWSTESMQTSNIVGRESPRFHNLIKLEVSCCRRLRFLLPHSVAKDLVNLKHLEVSFCMSMEQIIYETPTEVEETGDKSILPQLVHLKLARLPELTSFCLGKYNFDWPNKTEVVDTPKLRMVGVNGRETSRAP